MNFSPTHQPVRNSPTAKEKQFIFEGARGEGGITSNAGRFIAHLLRDLLQCLLLRLERLLGLYTSRLYCSRTLSMSRSSSSSSWSRGRFLLLFASFLDCFDAVYVDKQIQ